MALLVCVLAAAAFAVPFIAKGAKAWADTLWDISSGNITCDDPDAVYRITGSTESRNHVTVKKGTEDKPITIILDDLTITQGDSVDADNAPITIEDGYAVIKLEGESKLTAGRDKSMGYDEGRAAIAVNSDAHLTITSNAGDGSSDGRLVAKGGDNGSKGYGGSGIGSNYDHASGYITIDGGTIEATGGKCSAGIGSGRDGVCKSVIINGGTIIATGRDKAAGIGGGNKEGVGDGGETKTIVINGGNITATGGSDSSDGGAGIGGSNGDTDSVTINGGTIVAQGGKGGAGIGAGSDCHIKNVTIKNATVTATGGSNAAGIGGGNSQGAGDGGTVDEITITDSTITATGGDNGAGIGSGGDGSAGTITITGGKIDATGGKNATGIGAGHAAGMGSGGQAHNINIYDSDSYQLDLTATAKGEASAGIGSAGQKAGAIVIDLDGGTVTATGTKKGAGIGGGDQASDWITIGGRGTINATGGFNGCAIGAGNQGHADGPIKIVGDNLGGPAYGTGAQYALTLNVTALEDTGTNRDNYAALIGSGDGSSSDITIKNARIVYKSESSYQCGAIVGTGYSWDMSLHDGGIDTITLSHVKFENAGTGEFRGAGIGAGDDSTVNNIVLDEVDYTGTTIGSTTPSSLVFDKGYMKSISISNSKIDARAEGWTKSECEEGNPTAGIGTGPYGGITSITIKNSSVVARGAEGGAGIGSGGLMYTGGTNPEAHEVSIREAWTGRGKVNSIEITGSDIDAKGSFGGAGIGAGVLTSVSGHITIEDSSIIADGTGSGEAGASACGIGAGYLCGCGDITIKYCNVTAKGGAYAAGIGASGYDENNIFSDFMTLCWSESVGDITIEGSTVTATGGENAAGIGAGECTHADDSTFIIKDSTVTATGGKFGAGIGAGPERGSFQFGGDAGTINLLGDSVINATGGKGAAGIGGGFSGCVNHIYIGLTQDPQYYVNAVAGDGAAGIGAGCASGNWTSSGRDAHDVCINSGFVYAQGGNDFDNADSGTPSEHHPAGHIGAGAGVGGGSMHGTGNIVINGGVVVAHAGARWHASPGNWPEDIGSGGDNYDTILQPGIGKSRVTVHGGTVVGGLTDNNDITVTGGSVCHQIGGDDASDPKAKKDTDGNPRVFQNTLTLDVTGMTGISFGGETFYKVTLDSTSDDGTQGKDRYGTADIYALAASGSQNRAKVYLYLKSTDDDKAFADVMANGSDLHYYGTSSSGTNGNVLKMENGLKLVPSSDEPVSMVGSKFKLEAKASGTAIGSGTVTFDVNSEGGHVSTNRTETTMPGAWIELDCLSTGNFEVTAQADDGFDTELYWQAQASYNGGVVPSAVKLVITEDLSKMYDGTAVDNPAVVLVDQTGQVVDPSAYSGTLTYTYIDESDHSTVQAPSRPGTYEVKASVPATQDRDAAEAKAEFEITRARLDISVSVEDEVYDGAPQTATSAVTGVPGDSSEVPDLTLFYQKMSDEGSWEVIDSAPVDAGTYRAIAFARKSSCYKAAAAMQAFSILKASPSVEPVVAQAYDLADYPDGLTLGDVVLTNEGTPDGEWSWIARTEMALGEGEHQNAARFVPGDANYTNKAKMATFEVVDSTKQNWDVSVQSPTVLLSAKPFKLSVTVKDVDGLVQSNPTLTYAVKEGSDVVDVSADGTVTVKKAGSAKIAVTAAGTQGLSAQSTSAPSYLDTTVDATVTVDKGDPVIVIERPDKRYDGQAAQASVTVDSSSYPVVYAGEVTTTYSQKKPDGSYAEIGEAPVEVGDYAVKVKASSDDNYRTGYAWQEFSIYEGNASGTDSSASTGDGLRIFAIIAGIAVAAAIVLLFLSLRSRRHAG